MQIERQLFTTIRSVLAKSRYFHALMNSSPGENRRFRPHSCSFYADHGNNEEQELVLQRREGKWEILILSARTAAAYLSRLRQKLPQIKAMS